MITDPQKSIDPDQRKRTSAPKDLREKLKRNATTMMNQRISGKIDFFFIRGKGYRLVRRFSRRLTKKIRESYERTPLNLR